MNDTYDRTINYLRISVTDRCNLRCIYCMPKEGICLMGHEDILSYEEMLRIARLSVNLGIRKIRLTGGEPLVRRNITSFLSSLKGIPELEDISLTTNGILLYDLADDIYDTGIRRLNVSLDSLKKDKYTAITRGGNIDTVLKGIKRAFSIGFSPIKINVVAIKGFNDDEVIDFAALTMDKPYQIRFIEFMPVGNANLKEELGYLSNDEVKEKISKSMHLAPSSEQRKATDGPARIYKAEGALGTIGFISATSHQFCGSCNRLRLTADGKLRACLFSDNEIDLRTPLRKGISDEALQELIAEGIRSKPSGIGKGLHDAQRKKCAREMVSIGG